MSTGILYKPLLHIPNFAPIEMKQTKYLSTGEIYADTQVKSNSNLYSIPYTSIIARIPGVITTRT